MFFRAHLSAGADRWKRNQGPPPLITWVGPEAACVNNLDPPANRSGGFTRPAEPLSMCFAYFEAPSTARVYIYMGSVRDARHLSGPMRRFIHQSDTAE